MGKSKELAELGDFGGVVSSVDANGNVILRNDNATYSGQLSIQQTDQRLDLGSYWQSGVGQASYINATNSTGTVAEPLEVRTGGTTRMTIDASGRVTMPYQPWAFVIVNTPNPTLSSGSVTPYKNVISSQNLSWDTVNGGFTVPVTGVYQISAAMRLEGYNGTYLYYHIHVNGSPALGSPHFLGQPSAGSGFGTAAATTSIKLVQNDSVRIHWNWSGSNPLVCYASQSYVSVALLG